MMKCSRPILRELFRVDTTTLKNGPVLFSWFFSGLIIKTETLKWVSSSNRKWEV